MNFDTFFQRLGQWAKAGWRRWLQIRTLIVLARVPLLVVAVSALLAWQVDQVSELLLIAAMGETEWLVMALLTVAALGLSAWYSTRTLYRFKWPGISNQGMPVRMARWLPRLLALLLPLSIALTYLGFREELPKGGAILTAAWFGGIALALFLFTTFRRPLFNSFVRSSARRLDAQPEVAAQADWAQLDHLRNIHRIAFAVLIAGVFLGATLPGLMQFFGPLALVFGFAAMLIAASTAPIYHASRLDFPLVTLLVALGFVWSTFDLNDNHKVRLSAGTDSNRSAPPGLSYDAAGRASLEDYIHHWWTTRREECGDQAFFVSAAGGGIRAALWTAMVMSELEATTDGMAWNCTVAVSGVSGGSLGLASFAALKADSPSGPLPKARRDALLEMLETDFLSPVLGTMFGADLLQQLVPGTWVSDRGQALEDAWIRAYKSMGIENGFRPRSFSAPLAQSWCPESLCLLGSRDETRRLLPALFLNTTIVDDGRRLLQHPFKAISNFDLRFPGSVDGTAWFPAQLPLSSAVLNSARFTLVSPAGTVEKRESELQVMGQVVDGGYFENSGTTTLSSLIKLFRHTHPKARIRAIHISNDVGVAPFMAPGADGSPADRCPAENQPADAQPGFRGEVLAPLTAILNTRDARAGTARVELRESLPDGEGAMKGDKGRLWHYRLCPGDHAIPLGWTIGQISRIEMEKQLSGEVPERSARLVSMTEDIIARLATSAAPRREPPPDDSPTNSAGAKDDGESRPHSDMIRRQR